MKFLITGGAGFIGSNTARYLLSQGHQVVVLDSCDDVSLVPKEATLIRADIREFEPMEHAVKGVDVVVHLAAMVSVVESIQNPQLCDAINVLGSRNVLRASLEAGVKRVVLASSAAVYGLEPKTPTTEEQEFAPLSPYAKSKIDMEKHAALYSKQGIDCVCLRFFNVYGPGQRPDSQYAAAIPAFISRAKSRSEITIYGDGMQTRDFVFVEDVARAILAASTKGSGAYNVATGRQITILELAEKIISIQESKSKIVHESARQGDPRESLADVSKAEKELGFSAEVELEEGLKKTIASKP